MKNILSGRKIKLLYKAERIINNIYEEYSDEKVIIPEGIFIEFIQEKLESSPYKSHPLNTRLKGEKLLSTLTFCLVLNDENKIDKVPLNNIEFI